MIDLFIAGAQKAGTTSLLRYLGSHPQINSHHLEEFSHFAADTCDETTIANAVQKEFQSKPRGIVRVAKHAHLYKEDRFIERLAAISPNSQIAFIARDPTDRLISAYRMGVRSGWIEESLEGIVACFDRNQCRTEQQKTFNNVLIKLGLYDIAFEKLTRNFDPEQVHFVKFEDFVDAPEKVCEFFFRSLGVCSDFQPDVKNKHNDAEAKSRSDVAARLIRQIRDRGNGLRPLVKRLLPMSVYARVSRSLNQVSFDDSSYRTINPETLCTLRQLYEPSVRRFAIQSGLDLNDWVAEKN